MKASFGLGLEARSQIQTGKMEIYFDDLTHDKQRELLDAFGITDPAEMNWDVFPLWHLSPPENDSEENDA